MPTVVQLREESLICMQLAGNAADPVLRTRLKSRALALALRAEIEAEKERIKVREEIAAE